MCDFPLNKPSARNRSMETLEWVIVGIGIVLGSAIFSGVFAVLVSNFRDNSLIRSMKSLEANVDEIFAELERRQKQDANSKSREARVQNDQKVDAALGAIIQKVVIEGKKLEDLKTDPSMAQHAEAIPLIIKRYVG